MKSNGLELITLREFAQLRGRDVNTVRQWRRRGQLTAVKISGIWKVNRSLVWEFIPPGQKVPPGYITLSQYAKKLGVVPSTLRMRLKADTLPEAVKSGGWWVIPKRKIK